jgi:hypothetical protein
MSTGAECTFTEVKPGQYTYWLQAWPYGDNDEGTTYGPFASFRAAREDLRRNHANPGGWSVDTLPVDEHRHEWVTGEGWAPVGFDLSIRVESLGPDADPADVIRHVLSLPPDHPAFRVRSIDGMVPNVTRCDACGQRK